MSPDDPRHGRTTGYRMGCRCTNCRRACADAMARRRKGIYLARTDVLTVPNLGTRRRVQALVALGWSISEISRQAGYDRSHLGLMMRRPGPLRKTSAEKVAEVYGRLSMTLPPQETKVQKIDAARARNQARRNGWPPPLAWDDIDDPNERPTTITRETAWEDTVDHAVVWRVINGQPRPRQLTRAESAQVVHTLLSRGISTTAIERDYGLKAERYERLGESA